MAYPIGIIAVAVIVFFVGTNFGVPKFIVVNVSILLFGFGLYEMIFGRKDDEAKAQAQLEAEQRQRAQEEAERQRAEDMRLRKGLEAQEARWKDFIKQIEAQHQAEIKKLIESMSNQSNERIKQISGHIEDLIQKYKDSSIISDLSSQEIEAEVQKREQHIRAESQAILNNALQEAEAKHAKQLSDVQEAIKVKYDNLLREKEKAYSSDLSRQSQELEKVRQTMQREQEQVVANLNAQHEQDLVMVKQKFDDEQNQAISKFRAELDKVKEENANLQKELESRLADMQSRGECQHFQDKQIYDLLLRLMGQVKYRMDIICPWASHGVVNDKFLKKLAKMADRDVELYICYGYSEKDKRIPETEKCLEAMAEVYKERGKADKINIRFRKTHEKIIMCDDDLYFSTSCNVLSNPVTNGTGEGGILFHDKKSVEYRRRKDFGFKGIVFFKDIGKPKQ